MDAGEETKWPKIIIAPEYGLREGITMVPIAEEIKRLLEESLGAIICPVHGVETHIETTLYTKPPGYLDFGTKFCCDEIKERVVLAIRVAMSEELGLGP